MNLKLKSIAKKLLPKKAEVATLEEATYFFALFGKDINTLGISGISSDIPLDSSDYTRTFENLMARHHRSVTGPSAKITAEYNCVYEGENREEEGSQIFRQNVEQQHLEYIIPLPLEVQEEK